MRRFSLDGGRAGTRTDSETHSATEAGMALALALPVDGTVSGNTPVTGGDET